MELDDEAVRKLTKGLKTQEDFSALFKALRKRGLEAVLAGELSCHLGYDKNERSQERRSNSRNGYSKKTVTTDDGNLDLDIPRDRNGSYEPQLIKRHQTRFEGLDNKILSLYARGLSVRDIQAELSDLYDDAISTSLISSVTDSVLITDSIFTTKLYILLFPLAYLIVIKL